MRLRRAPASAIAALAVLLACDEATDRAARAPPDAADADAADARVPDASSEPEDAAAPAPDAMPEIVDAAVPDAAPLDASDPTPVVPDAAGGGDTTVRCEIGIAEAEGDAGVVWAPLPAGATLPMIGGGQGSLSVELGLRVLEPTLPLDVRVVIRTSESGRSDTWARTVEGAFECGDDGWCTLVPIYVPTQTLVDDPFDLMLLDVALTATFGEIGDPFCVATLSGQLLRKE